YIIPVVFHIIHNNGAENISDAQVYDAVRVLNQDYNKLNTDWTTVRPDFLDRVADVGIEFRLATIDPQGNCTNGVTRTVSTQTYDGDFEMTQLIQWPRNRYMNIWVAASAGDGVAGYTYYPMWLDNWPEADGIVVDHTYVGAIGTSSTYHSRVLTHEVGHWLNLAHCWGSTNEPGEQSNCSSDDGVADTPNTVGWTACNLNGATCGSPLDNVENYMEYSYCCKMFTEGQGDRMIAALTSGVAQRSSLWQPNNLLQTGVTTAPVLCNAGFTHGRSDVCVGSTVQFTDISYHGVTERLWNFPGGTPSTSTEAAPIVQYDTPGTYPVTMQVSDGVNELTVVQESLVHVFQSPGIDVPVTEGFESTTLNDVAWNAVDNDGDGTFAPTSLAAYTGNQSVRLTNTTSSDGRKDYLYSPTYDLSDATDILITFRYAFAQRNASNDDRLRFYVSNNCGLTWSMRKQLRAGTDLNTVGIVGGDLIPNGPDQWGLAVVDNISSSYHAENFRLRFEFESDGGNNVYIDDININGVSVGMQEPVWDGSGFMIVPNPASSVAHVLFTLPDAGMVAVDLLDALGREVLPLHQGTLGAGQHRLAIPMETLSNGMYLLRVVRKEGASTRRFVVNGSR
ncbi:MAG: choice-of-anchor J domain-containing protein, partial [Flavobacteriales bacterium]|nr:choice-of-anchor J domain-containing protein [Flavobacteriales bacterium]